MIKLTIHDLVGTVLREMLVADNADMLFEIPEGSRIVRVSQMRAVARDQEPCGTCQGRGCPECDPRQAQQDGDDRDATWLAGYEEGLAMGSGVDTRSE